MTTSFLKTRAALMVVAVLAFFGLALSPAVAHAQDQEISPEQVAPLPITSVPLRGEVFANGHNIGEIDFAVIWSEEDPSQVQLWAVFNNTPSPVCFGDVFDAPSGDPVFFGTTSLTEPAGTCMMSQLPDRSAISLMIASNDGQWASALLSYPGSVEPVPIFE